jgi:HK97 family phage major capsid protein
MWGTGVGQPQGAFNSDACVSQAKESGQAAETIEAENIMKMYSRIYSPRKAKGAWYYNAECLPQLLTLELTVGTGGQALYIPAGGLASLPNNTIFGRPAYETEHCEALGTVGDIVFGNFSDYLVVLRSRSAKTAMSVHLRFQYDETAFRSTFSIDGRPWWDKALTPRKGSSTLSPWVKLATRA